MFAFGHGLSYTSFEYGKITLDKQQMDRSETLTVTLPVTNTGDCEGKEVVQLYVSDLKSSLPRPIKELKAFKKIRLAPGETQHISFEINKEALSFYDPQVHDWVAEPGRFKILIGSASDDIRSSASFVLK